MAETRARGGASASRRRVRRFFIALGALCLLATVFAALVLRGVIRLNTPSRADFPVWGVDVSHYQGDIDWKRSRRRACALPTSRPRRAAAIPTSASSKTPKTRPWRAFPPAATTFSALRAPEKTQAENFLSALRDQPLSLPCAVDFEFYGEFFDHPPDVEATRAELRALLEALEAETGRKPVLYATSRSYRMYLQGAFDDYPLWIRDVYLWPALTLPGGDWTFWQYSDKGLLDGYQGEEQYIDLNVFHGDEAAFKRWLQDV